jgi:hypothetical protein
MTIISVQQQAERLAFEFLEQVSRVPAVERLFSTSRNGVRQSAITATATLIGSVFAGPLGGVLGAGIGGLFAYTSDDDYQVDIFKIFCIT